MKEVLIDYLMINCKGYDNRQKAYQLMPIVDIQDHKTFRSLIEEIRQEDNQKKQYLYVVKQVKMAVIGYLLNMMKYRQQ